MDERERRNFSPKTSSQLLGKVGAVIKKKSIGTKRKETPGSHQSTRWKLSHSLTMATENPN